MSGVVGDAATFVSASIDIVQGNKEKGVTKLATGVISEVAGGLIDKSTAKAGAKLAMNAGKVLVDKVMDNAINSLPGTWGTKNSGITMQRSSIPSSSPPPPKPLIKKKTT